MAKYRTKIRCGDCGRVIPMKDGGSLKKGKKFECGHCGHTNKVSRKKNGKTIIG
jgi:DNA-directed RNA polymerase subunit RPC12/RpoP